VKLAPLESRCDEASVVGAYRPDRYVMVFRDQQPPPIVFVHEYIHYLQNLTTVHGVKSFLATQQLLALFSRTMLSDGTSLGSPALTDEQRREVARYGQLRHSAEGETGPADDQRVYSEVVALAGNKATFALKRIGHFSQGQTDVVIGGRAIKESVAHLVEVRVAELTGIPAPLVPEFPYSILTRLFRFVVGRDADPPMVIAALGTLALLTVAPNRGIIEILEDYKSVTDGGAGLTPFDAVVAISVKVLQLELRASVPIIVGNDLPSIVHMHRRRNSATAIEFLCSESSRALNMRLEDPLFDLRPLFQDDADAAMRGLLALFGLIEPCDMLLGSSAVGTLRRGLVGADGLDMTQHLLSFSAQQEFMMMHEGADGQFLPTASITGGACPFLGACTHPTTKEHPDNCAKAPWKNFKMAKDGCWFTNGMIATMGESKLTRVE
jgi:hypothetical protein